MFAFWGDLDTRRTARNMRSLFDDTFLIGTPDQPEIKDLEQVARGNSVPLSGTAPANAGEDLKAHVRAGLGLTAAEIDLLWPTTGTVTVSMLSQIYRIAIFSHAAGITVVDYFDFVALTGTDPFPALPTGTLPARIIKVFDDIVDIGRAQSTNMAAGEIEYYLTDFAEAGDPFVAKREDLNAAAQRLALSVGAIAGALPANPHPDATALSTLLAKVVPADKVVRAVTIVVPVLPAGSTPPNQLPPGLPPQADVDFLKRYFDPFIAASPGPDAFLTALFAEPDGPSRYKMVFDQLNDVPARSGQDDRGHRRDLGAVRDRSGHGRHPAQREPVEHARAPGRHRRLEGDSERRGGTPALRRSLTPSTPCTRTPGTG